MKKLLAVLLTFGVSFLSADDVNNTLGIKFINNFHENMSMNINFDNDDVIGSTASIGIRFRL